MRTFIDGRYVLKTTGTDQFDTALRVSEGWYRKLLKSSVDEERRHPIDRLSHEPTVAELFPSYKKSIEKAKRPDADMRWGPIQDFWRTLRVSEVNTRTFRDFFSWRRRQTSKPGTHTLHKDVVLIRQLLKFAIEEEHITAMPLIPKVGKIDKNPRPWLTSAEWQKLVTVSEGRIQEAAHNSKLLRQRQDLHDQMVFMVSSMVRVGEMLNLRFADCKVERNKTGENLLVANVNGKHGHRTIVAPSEAAAIIQRRDDKQKDEDEGKVFAEHHRDAFQGPLKAAKLYTDNEGFSRNMKSLRATAISFRVLQPNPNLLMIARNARTSLTMIDQFYAKRLSAEMNKEELSCVAARARRGRRQGHVWG